MKYLHLLLIVLPGFVFGQFYEIGDNLNVNARSGLNVRSTPAINGSKVGFLEYGQRVEVISKEYLTKRDTFENLDGGWVEIESEGIRGFVFDGFLTKLPILNYKMNPKNEEKGVCLFNSMNRYIKNNFVAIDTTNYYNGADGEGSHGMKIINLRDHGQFIKHSYWESFGDEFQIEKVRKVESFLFVKSLFESCNLWTKEIEEKLIIHIHHTYIELFRGEFEVSLGARWTEDRFYFSIEGGP